MTKIIVASKNPVKLTATQDAFEKMFPNESFEVEGASIPSDVTDQPMSEEETFEGATNRVANAKSTVPADYWVGIEGGIKEVENNLEAFAWIVIESKTGVIGKGRTGSFFLPEKVATLVHEGKELGDADDIIFGMSNSKQSSGSVGILTDDILTRVPYYEQAVILALIPFKNPSLY